jgi:hypothetical protein
MVLCIINNVANCKFINVYAYQNLRIGENFIASVYKFYYVSLQILLQQSIISKNINFNNKCTVKVNLFPVNLGILQKVSKNRQALEGYFSGKILDMRSVLK